MKVHELSASLSHSVMLTDLFLRSDAHGPDLSSIHRVYSSNKQYIINQRYGKVKYIIAATININKVITKPCIANAFGTIRDHSNDLQKRASLLFLKFRMVTQMISRIELKWQSLHAFEPVQKMSSVCE